VLKDADFIGILEALIRQNRQMISISSQIKTSQLPKRESY
jgi:hypothetical protein